MRCIKLSPLMLPSNLMLPSLTSLINDCYLFDVTHCERYSMCISCRDITAAGTTAGTTAQSKSLRERVNLKYSSSLTKEMQDISWQGILFCRKTRLEKTGWKSCIAFWSCFDFWSRETKFENSIAFQGNSKQRIPTMLSLMLGFLLLLLETESCNNSE